MILAVPELYINDRINYQENQQMDKQNKKT